MSDWTIEHARLNTARDYALAIAEIRRRMVASGEVEPLPHEKGETHELPRTGLAICRHAVAHEGD